MYSQPLQTPPSYSSPWNTKPLSMFWSLVTLAAISWSSSHVLGARVPRLLQQILPIVEEPGVRVPGDGVELAVIGRCLYRTWQERARILEFVGEVGDPSVYRELGRPYDVPDYEVYPAAAGLELGPELVEVLARVYRHLLLLDLEVLALLVELIYELGQASRVVRCPGDDEVARAAAAATAPRRAEQGSPREPGAPELEEFLATQARARSLRLHVAPLDLPALPHRLSRSPNYA